MQFNILNAVKDSDLFCLAPRDKYRDQKKNPCQAWLL